MRLRRTLTEVADAAEAVRNNVEVHSGNLAMAAMDTAFAAQETATAMRKIAACVWLYGALITAAVIVYVLRED